MDGGRGQFDRGRESVRRSEWAELVSKVALAGLILLGVGTVIGVLGSTTPVTAMSQQSVQVINAPITVAANDYATQNLAMAKGQVASVALTIENKTIFTLDIMNKSQFYVYSGCAPECAQPLLGGTGTYYQQAGEADPTELNVTISASSPYSGTFTAPANGTYYFVLDNTIGPTWANYVHQNVSGPTVGTFTLTTTQAVETYAVNWPIVGSGAVVILFGGTLATLKWGRR